MFSQRRPLRCMHRKLPIPIVLWPCILHSSIRMKMRGWEEIMMLQPTYLRTNVRLGCTILKVTFSQALRHV
jgi:hypothetical protein